MAKRLVALLFLGAIALLVTTCSNDNPLTVNDPPPGTTDHINPAAPRDLRLVGVDGIVVRLAFTATGDDSLTGQAAAFELRLSLTYLTPSNFDSATAVADLPTLPDPGDSVTVTVRCADTATTYYFAVRVLDEGGNKSAISNVVEATTGGTIDSIAPGRVVDLAGERIDADSITLTWTAVGDDGNSGVAAEYSIRWSRSPITPTAFDTLPLCSNQPRPSPSGTREAWVVYDPPEDTLLYVALKVKDGADNWSEISNIAEIRYSPDMGVVWQYTLDSIGYDAADIVEMPDGDVMVVGNSSSGGVLIRLNSGGEVQLIRFYPGIQVRAISEDGQFVVGRRESVSTGSDIWLGRINSAGDVTFDTSYAWAGSQTGTDIVQKDDRLYIAAGFVMAVTLSGEVRWSDTLLKAGVSSLASTESGVIGLGTKSWQDPNVPPQSYIYFVSIDSLGEVVRSYTPEPDGAGGGRLAGDPQTGYAATGTSWRGIEVVRLDAASDPAWQTVYWSAGGDPVIRYAVPIADGGCLAVGADDGPPMASSSNMLLLRFSNSGQILWERSLEGDGFNTATAVVKGADGSYLIAGTVELYTADRKIRVFKYRE